jgi:hypothetical protein
VVDVVRLHCAFTARHWNEIPADEVDPRNAFADRPWFELASRFVDEWDMQSFDPSYAPLPLEHFAPIVKRLVVAP